MLRKYAKTFAPALIALSLFCNTTAAAGQFDGDYTVEMIVFERPNVKVEAASLNDSLRYPSERVLLDRDVRSGNLKTVKTLEDSALSLAEEAAKIRKRGYKILFHEAWEQYVDARPNPAVVILGGNSRNGLRELSGYVSVYVKRYLHFQTNLWLINQRAVNIAEDEVFTLIEIPSPVSNRAVQGANISSISQVKTSRKMRSSQLHYIDHPQLGILVEISK